jgi:hypothetical protein
MISLEGSESAQPPSPACDVHIIINPQLDDNELLVARLVAEAPPARVRVNASTRRSRGTGMNTTGEGRE